VILATTVMLTFISFWRGCGDRPGRSRVVGLLRRRHRRAGRRCRRPIGLRHGGQLS
jgi:hypothetical protein